MKKIVLISIFYFVSSFAQTDIIEPVNLISGRTDSVLVSDMFYAPEYNIEVGHHNNIKAKFNKDSKYLILSPNNNFEGFTLLDLAVNNNQISVPVYINKMLTKVFKYKPLVDAKKINVFGSFNGWDRQKHTLTDENNDGTYEIEVDIEPGRYEYKYFVDGKELVDHGNPEKVSNGMGDYNNIVTIASPFNTKAFLHVLDFSDKKNLLVKFYYEKEKQERDLELIDVFVLLNNKKVSVQNISIEKNIINVSIPKSLLGKKDLLRVCVTQRGQTTNLQNVFLENGKPATTKSDDWRTSIIYSLMVDRFNDGDKSNSIPVKHPELTPQANYHGGDIKGIINKIEEGYFEKLGVNTLWITPVIDNTPNAYKEYPAPNRYYTGYHGYWPVSFEKIEERFGNLDLFKKFTSISHNNGMRVLLDYVGHHIHIEHPYWDQHRDWFGSLELPDGRKNLRLWDEYRLTTWFEPYMPSFDYTKSKEAVEVMTDNAIWWLNETGIDGFRHDAVKHVPNLFWRRLTEKIKVNVEIPKNKKVYQIGETFGSFDLIKSYVNNGQMNAQFNFNLYDAAIPTFTEKSTSFSALNNQMQKSFAVYGYNHLMGNLMDSHDKNRFMAYADGDLGEGVLPEKIAWENPPKVDNPKNYNKLRAYMSYLLTTPGIPIIYYGDEIGMTGASDPDNRRMMRFGKDVTKEEKKVFDDVSKLISIRRNHSSLNFGDFQTLIADPSIYAYLRSDLNERILVIINKGDKEESKTLDIPELYNIKKAKDLITGKSIKVTNNKIKITVPSIGYKILELQK